MYVSSVVACAASQFFASIDTVQPKSLRTNFKTVSTKLLVTMETEEDKKRKSDHVPNHAKKQNTANEHENGDQNAPKNKKKEKKIRTCRFLKSAINITNTNSFVVIATKIGAKKDAKDANDVTYTNSVGVTQNEEVDPNNEEKGVSKSTTKAVDMQLNKKKKPKKKTPVLTTCHLPEAQSMDTLVISPQDALAHIYVHFREKMYKKVEIYVKPLLVLDVNGILCHRIRSQDLPPTLAAVIASQQEIEIKNLYRTPIGHVAYTDIVARTDIVSFLQYLNEHYTLAVWSSAKKKTVKSLVRMLFPERIEQQLLFVWGQEKCNCVEIKDTINTEGGIITPEETIYGLGLPDVDTTSETPAISNYTDRKQAFKDMIFMKHLSKVWGEFPLWNETNTLLIDDSPEKCCKSKGNSIHPPPILGLDGDVISSLVKALNVNDKHDAKPKQDNFDILQFNDVENQANQLQFFQTLTASWKMWSEHESDEFLSSFLKENARGYMNWQPDD